MKKIVLLLSIVIISFAGDVGNIGFLTNQKYLCISKGMIIEDRIVPIMSQEEAMQYPVRIYVDDKRILHNDGVQDMKLLHVKDNVYQNEEKIVMLQVDNGQRVMMMAMKELKYIPSLYVCIETDNWTLR